MPTPTYTPLANITLGSSAASVTFSSISQAYRDLVLVVNGVSTVNSDNFVRFNSDTSSNYSGVFVFGNGSTASSSFQSAATQLEIGGFDGSITGSNILQIMDYSVTDKQKTTLVRTNSSAYVQTRAGRWASTSAITTILIYPSSGSFATGTSLALYGIAA